MLAPQEAWPQRVRSLPSKPPRHLGGAAPRSTGACGAAALRSAGADPGAGPEESITSSDHPPLGAGMPDSGAAPASTAAQNACATSGCAMSLCAPDAPTPLRMTLLASRL